MHHEFNMTQSSKQRGRQATPATPLTIGELAQAVPRFRLAVDFRIAHLRVTATTRGDVRFGDFAGTGIRGLFGTALHRTSCKRPQGMECPRECAQPRQCAYGRLYEGAEGNSKGAGSRRLYAVRPPPRRFAAPSGQPFSFDIMLLGLAVERSEVVARALLNLPGLHIGLGGADSPIIETAELFELAPWGYRPLQGGDAAEGFSIGALGAPAWPRCRVVLQQPLALRREQRWVEQPSLLDLVELAESRLRGLGVLPAGHAKSGAAGVMQRPSPWGEFVRPVLNAPWERLHMHGVCAQRHSRRKGRHEMRGAVGEMAVETGGDPRVLAPLVLGAALGIGKAVTMGCGVIDLQPLSRVARDIRLPRPGCTS